MVTRPRFRRARSPRSDRFVRDAAAAACPACGLESLESRILFSFPPMPINPAPGESQLLQQAVRFAENNNLNALDKMPIPYSVVTSYARGDPVITKNNPHSNAPMRVDVDVDGNLATGRGGKDIAVQVSTELFLNGSFNPHLLMTIDRLGTAPFASDFEVLISFPFTAFNFEPLPGDPNVFIGYRTTGAGGPDDAGGIAPVREQIRFIPNTMLGANHQVQIQLSTTGASNPLQFITGHFDGNNQTGILNAGAYAAWVEQPPQNISIGLGVGNSLLGPIDKSFNLSWTASSSSKVIFDYLEQEDGPLTASDFNTKVTFDQMPTSETLSLKLDEVAGEFTLSHRANAPIGKVEILAERKDGLTITGTLTDVPTEVDLTLGLSGYATLNVNANTLDMKLEVEKEGGFLDTSDFLGYDIGYASLGLKDAPDLSIGFIPGTNSVGVQATNPGECIGAVELIISATSDLLLPPHQEGLGFAPWDDPNPRHIFSLVDDGTLGTAAVRFVHVQQATFELDATNISELFTLITCEAAPFTGYLRTTVDSNIIPGHDIEITMNVNDFPAGNITFEIDPPFGISYTITPSQGIDLIHIFGHIDDTHFDIIGGNLPAVFSFSFDPDGSLSVTADDGDGIFTPGNPGDHIGLLGAVFFNDVHPDGLSGATKELFGQPVREARFRLDSIPSFNATWSDDEQGTSIMFDTVAPNAYLGGAQVEVSTEVTPLGHLPAPLAAAPHYLRFRDEGGSNQKRLAAGAFGIDRVVYESEDIHGTYTVSFRSNSPRPLEVTFDSRFTGKFFPQYDSDLTFGINNVPQTFDFLAHLNPGFRYTASSAISRITLTGTLDDTNDSTANGTNIVFDFVNLPSDVRFSLETAPVRVVGGMLDLDNNGLIDANDSGFVGGIRVINGQLDMNGSGTITAADTGTFLGFNVLANGRLDINGDGVVNGLDFGDVSGLELKMNGNVTSISLSMESSHAILGSPYQLFEADIVTVPAHTLATWSNGRILVETRNAAGAPLPLGSASALLSTSRNPADIANKLVPFTTSGPGGARINYSPYLQTIDSRYLNASGAGSVISRLNGLYGNAQVLDANEDHVIARVVGDTVDLASVQITGFQKLLIDPGLNGGTYEMRKPVPGVSPLLLGAGLNDVFAVVQFDNIPDLMQLNTNIAGRSITWHTEDDVFASIGNVDIYVGPAGMAADNQMAARFVMKDVPSDVHIFWNFGFPSGSANFVASNQFELLALAQDGSNRLVGGLRLQDLQVGYTMGFNPHFDVDWFGPIPTELSLMLFTAKAGLDNDVNFDGGGNPIIGANHSKPGVDGFFGLYSMTANPGSLIDASGNSIGGPAPAASEYTPDLTFLMKGFREFSLTLDVGIELLPAFLSPDIELSYTLVGDFAIDFWAGHVDITAEAFVEFGFLNFADHRDNTPIHLVPFGSPVFRNIHSFVYTFDGFHDFEDHFDPFA